uniref:Uncharacterized protein n=1 Tax=Pararge aegeria TaxID=116150 RepID=S4NTM2_9NEOP
MVDILRLENKKQKYDVYRHIKTPLQLILSSCLFAIPPPLSSDHTSHCRKKYHLHYLDAWYLFFYNPQ